MSAAAKPELSSPQIVRDLFASGRRVELKPGDLLFREGEPITEVYCVERGNVVVTRYAENGERQILAFLFPGDFLGVTVGAKYTAGAEAVTDVAVMAVSQSKLQEELATRPAVGAAFAEMTARILENVMDLIFTLGRKNARARLASFLLHLRRRQERLGIAADSIYVPMTRQDVADLLGLTMETVSRSFSQLKAANAIRFHGSDVEVVDLGKLSAEAELKS